ncbi:MAG TPA: VTT domain-containing protein [Gammaproteobacteria bacterium]
MPEFLQPLMDAVSDRPYLFIFVGLLVAGELVLIPAIYLAVTGRLELAWVFLVAVAAMGISDLVWYYLGRALPRERLRRMGGGRIGGAMNRLEALYARRGPQILIGSKFVYGTRTAAQVLAGANAMPVSTYLAANTVGIALLTSVLFAIGYSVRGTIGRLEDLAGRIEIAFLVFVALAVAIHLLAAKVLRARWSR